MLARLTQDAVTCDSSSSDHCPYRARKNESIFLFLSQPHRITIQYGHDSTYKYFKSHVNCSTVGKGFVSGVVSLY